MAVHSFIIRLGKSLILAAAVAGCYFVLGLLGLLFRFYGDPVGILMPSAGFALIAVLFFGHGILPGVILGSFCLNAWAFDFKQGLLAFYIAVAFGAGMAASLGASSIRKKIGFPNALIDFRCIVTFLMLGGPLSCLLSATVASVAMYFSSIIGFQQIPLAWLSWWLADVIGIMIFAPMLLTLVAEPHPVWRRRRVTVGLPVTVAFALVFLLFCYMQKVDHEKTIEHLKEKSYVLARVLEHRLQDELHAVETLGGFFSEIDDRPDSEDFKRLARRILAQHREIREIGWFASTETSQPKYRPVVSIDVNESSSSDWLKSIPAEIKQTWTEVRTYHPSVLIASKDGNLHAIVPTTITDDPAKGLSGVIAAEISMESLMRETLIGLHSSRCTLSIEEIASGRTVPMRVYSNIALLESLSYETIDITAGNRIWRLNFYHEGPMTRPIDDRSIEWIAFDGLCLVGLLAVMLLHLTGRFFRTEAVIEDRTKKLQEMKASAESANNAKNQFLAKISHELRTPLNGISGFTQLLEKKPSLTKDDRKHVAIIKQCADNLHTLINDILDISAIESQQLKTEIGEFDYAALLHECINIFKFKAEEKGLRLIFDNTCAFTRFVGDEKRIRQIIGNLIDNAIKYTHQGNVTVNSTYENGSLRITVADTGCGIDHNNLERIFSPFVQINSGNLSREGVGLGLPIIKELVHLMNGELTVTSELGFGSTFSVRIPLPVGKDNPGTVQSPMLPAEETAQKMRVLVVDDNEINLLFLLCLLEQLGCKADSAGNGREALVLVERNFYDLALIDINMPIMNGLELVQHLRSRQLSLCLVAVSAYADQDKINEALRCGFDAYLTKPIEEKELIEIIKFTKKYEKIR